MVQQAATWCNMVQQAATCCNMVQQAATGCYMVRHGGDASQVGLLAWIVDKFHLWGDCAGRVESRCAQIAE
jgi:hypothetical protein